MLPRRVVLNCLARTCCINAAVTARGMQQIGLAVHQLGKLHALLQGVAALHVLGAAEAHLDEEVLAAVLADAVDDLGRTFVVPLDGVGHVEQHVGVRQGAAHEIHHRLLQLVRGLQDAGRVGVDDLEILARDDAHDAVACGLRLGGDDREFFAHEGVHQRRFAHVGIADDIYEAGTVHFFCFIRRQR